MDDNFQKILAKTLIWEGGFVDNPLDPGGRTNKGITQREYDSYRKRKVLPFNDVKNISDDEVTDIYYTDYYFPTQANLMTDIKVSWKVFDIGVNTGISRSIKYIQTIIGVVVDGQFGPNSLAVLKKYQQNSNWANTMMSLLVKMQVQHYNDIVTLHPNEVVFLKGWLRRVNDTGLGL